MGKVLSHEELEALKTHPGVAPHKPPCVGWCSHVLIQEGETMQWHGQRADGLFHPWGPILPIPRKVRDGRAKA